ncbi:M81 family metallopeptidase [Paraburkholderia tropica]|uniref:M81 family metallopeptidase n=1 Tax=Paraburkholderia tropica TaxID=92647 RepID=UPI002AB70F19|nr:M81 family metallopeptidase [Paraburkholderia tropica]
MNPLYLQRDKSMTIRSGTFRVAVGGVAHETNTYATEYLGVTELTAFHQYCGEEIERAFSGTNHPLGGFIAGAAKHQLDLAYTFFGQATPSGTIKAGAYAEMKNRVLEGVPQAMPLDAVLLALHGAAVAEGTEDVEGDLATAVREIVGPDVPIAAVYDLHGNMTERMKTACTLTLPCKLYPHTDLGERGEEAVRLLMRILCGESRPFTYMCQLPMLPYIVATEANFAPVAVNELCRTISGHPGVIDCSWFHGFPYADVAAPCPTVICTTESDPELAKSCAVKVADRIWKHREDFKPRSLTPAQGVAEAMAENGGLLIINEYADTDVARADFNLNLAIRQHCGTRRHFLNVRWGCTRCVFQGQFDHIDGQQRYAGCRARPLYIQ